MSNFFYVIVEFNSRFKRYRFCGLFENWVECFSKKCILESDNKKVFISYSINECSFKDAKNLIDNDLITRCYNIANCLELAERALLRKRYSISKDWFNIVSVRSGEASSLIDDLL